MKKRPVLVCVTAQSSCEVLIYKGRLIAEELGCPLEVVSVQSIDMTADDRASALDTLYSISKKSSADIVVYYNDNPAETVALHARRSRAIHILTGLPADTKGGFIKELERLLPGVPITSVDENYVFAGRTKAYSVKRTASVKV